LRWPRARSVNGGGTRRGKPRRPLTLLLPRRRTLWLRSPGSVPTTRTATPRPARSNQTRMGRALKRPVP